MKCNKCGSDNLVEASIYNINNKCMLKLFESDVKVGKKGQLLDLLCYVCKDCGAVGDMHVEQLHIDNFLK